jgi:hypothetical protein
MKKIIQLTCLALAIGFSTGVHAQATWFFGNGAGLKFDPALLTNPSPIAQPTATMSGSNAVSEGCATLVDAANKVIMYTNGVRIWNGAGTMQLSPALPPPYSQPYALGGNSSSTQNVVIVPIPGTSTSTSVQKVFIFTVSAAELCYAHGVAGKEGLRVSLATITGTAPNCTITIIPSEESVLLTPAGMLMSEKLTVSNFFVASNGEGGFWVLTHGIGAFENIPNSHNGVVNTTNINQPGERSFFAYHVTCNTTTISALDATEKESVLSSAVSPHRSWSHPTGNNLDLSVAISQVNSQSQMKFSPNLAKVALTLPWTNNAIVGSALSPDPVGQLYDFDRNTGMVGGVQKVEFLLGFYRIGNGTKDGASYGLEFSPNSNFLYITSSFVSSQLASITTRIYKYDVTTWTPGAAIAVTGASYYAPLNSMGSYAALQLGPDNKIYVAKQNSNFLSVINNPDNTGAASGFVDNAIPLTDVSVPGPAICMSGLPGTVMIANTASVPSILSTTTCSGSDIVAFGSHTGEIPDSHSWELYTSNASGVPVNAAGATVSLPSLAAHYTINTPFPLGTAPGSHNFGGTSMLPCGKYYTVRLILKGKCQSPLSYPTAQHTFYLLCTPTPAITGNTTICSGSSTTLCVNYSPAHSTTVSWINYPTSSPQCITVSPTTTTYPVWVTQNGCVGTASATVNVIPNYTNFTLSSTLSPVTNPFYTAIATPTVDPGTIPGLYFHWEVTEIDLVTGNPISGTEVISPDCWWNPSSVNNFKGYIGGTSYVAPNNGYSGFNLHCTAVPGQFITGHKYRVKYATFSATCPWTEMYATMYMCNGGCRLANGSNAIIEYGPLSYENTSPSATQYKASAEEEITVFPNPSNGIFTLNFAGEGEKSITVYDLMGNIVFEKTNSLDAMLTLDLANEANGIYLVKVVCNGQVSSKRIIKQ